MSDPVLIQTQTGTSAVATTTATFTAATAGNLLVLIAAADAYKTGDPSGWTAPTGGAQQTFLGHYMWFKVAAGGETSVAYTIGAATTSAWIVLEFNNVLASPYDTSNGQLAANSDVVYTTPAVIPSAGRRLAVATIADSRSAPSTTTQSTWLNGYTEVADLVTPNTTGTNQNVAAATLLLDGDGSTATSTGSSFSFGPDARTAIIAVFKASLAGTTLVYGYSVRIG
jgi:hypothetical protein